MRKVVGYDAEGHKIWSENVPAEAPLPARPRGELVVGGSGPSADEQKAQQKKWAEAYRERQRTLRGENVADPAVRDKAYRERHRDEILARRRDQYAAKKEAA